MKLRNIFFLPVFLVAGVLAVSLVSPFFCEYGADDTVIAEKRLLKDIRTKTKEISNITGYPISSLPKISVEYIPKDALEFKCTDGKTILAAATYDNNHISVSRGVYKKGYFGEDAGIRTFIGHHFKTFSGRIDYEYTTAHEVGHHFFAAATGWETDTEKWGYPNCGTEYHRYDIISDGFADYAAYELLLKKGKELNDSEYEQYVATSVAYYLMRINQIKGTNSLGLKDIPVTLPFSEKSIAYIDKMLARFKQERPIDPCKAGNGNVQECYRGQYAEGWLLAYEWKARYPNGAWDDGTIADFICGRQG
jgi:hypothetical protein